MKLTLSALNRAVPLWPQLAAIVALMAIGSVLIEGFASFGSIISLLVLASIVAIAASGQTNVALLGSIDLSIPAVMAMANVMTAALTNSGWPFILVAALIVLFSVVIGAFNGLISMALQINALVITLATGSIVGGAILAWTGGAPTGLAPRWLFQFVAPSGTVLGGPIPAVLVLWFVFAAVQMFVQRRTVFGRWIYATGSNSQAAQIAGVPTTLVWSVTFAASAASAGLAGVLLAGFTSQGDVRASAPFLFSTVACVVIGGTSMVGAQGGYGRTILGAIILTVMTSLLVALGLTVALQQAILGALIILVVASYGREDAVAARL